MWAVVSAARGGLSQNFASSEARTVVATVLRERRNVVKAKCDNSVYTP